MSNTITYGMNRSDVAAITAHLLRADASFAPVLSSRVDIKDYAQKLQDRAARFEAWQGQELVGLVAAYCNQPERGTAFLSSVSVLAEFRGQGIAGWLMQQCLEYAHGLGFGHVSLEVDGRSAPAVGLYQKLGFKTVGKSGPTLTMSMTFEG